MLKLLVCQHLHHMIQYSTKCFAGYWVLIPQNYYFLPSTSECLLTGNDVIYVIRLKSVVLVVLLNMYFGHMVVIGLMTMQPRNTVVISWHYQPSWSLKQGPASCRTQWNCQMVGQDAGHHGHCQGETPPLYTYIQGDTELHTTYRVTPNYTQWNCRMAGQDAGHHGHCQGETPPLYTYIQGDTELHTTYRVISLQCQRRSGARHIKRAAKCCFSSTLLCTQKMFNITIN